MSHPIRITAANVSLAAELNDGPTARAILEALPIEGTVSRWGDEIYFGIGVDQPEEPGAIPDVQVGDLAYWPPGRAFCLFFGPTPASDGAQPRAASPVNVVGRALDDAAALKSVPDGAMVRIAPA